MDLAHLAHVAADLARVASDLGADLRKRSGREAAAEVVKRRGRCGRRREQREKDGGESRGCVVRSRLETREWIREGFFYVREDKGERDGCGTVVSYGLSVAHRWCGTDEFF